MPGGGEEPKRTLGELCAPICAVHGSDPGVGEPPLPALSQLWHVFHMEITQFQAPDHSNVCQGRVEEEKETAVKRGAEDNDSGLSGLRETFVGSVGFQIPWEGTYSFG